MILLIDNYDSFVYNLARYFRRLGQRTDVYRNDKIDTSMVRSLNPDAIVLSPGPCGPSDAGICIDVVRQFHKTIPILGVCLGHQAIAEALGARVRPTEKPMHGRSSTIDHDGVGIFVDVPNPTTVARYHSLVAVEETLPGGLHVSARTVEGVVMALRHDDSPCTGVQFHPESILTPNGYQMIKNFLEMNGISVIPDPTFDDELIQQPDIQNIWPKRPVTF